MAEIRPFRALRYNPEHVADLSEVIAPPYDVIGAEQKEILLRQSPHNIIHLTLGDPSTLCEEERKDPARFAKAANTLDQWQKDQVLVRDNEPSLYVYENCFFWKGSTYTRKGLLLTVRLEAFGGPNILPHEKTLAAPIEDRMALTKATKAQLEPIFMICQDEGKLSQWMDEFSATKPHVDFHDRNTQSQHRMWKVSSQQAIAKLQNKLAPQPFLIADGHHRYTTALAYGQEVEHTKPAAQWILTYLTPAPSKGLILSSIHRRVKTQKTSQNLLRELNSDFEIESAELSWDAFFASGALLALVDKNKMHLLSPKPNVLEKLPQELHAVPTSILNELVLLPHLGLDLNKPADQERVLFGKDPEQFFNEIQAHELAFWVRPLCVPDVFAATQAGLRLPQKSTFFFPKVMSGLVLHLLDDQK